MKKENIGSSFDDWLREEGLYEEASSVAVKRVLTRQILKQMDEQKMSKSEMAKRMETSRAAVDRLLDPENDAVRWGRCSGQLQRWGGSCVWSWCNWKGEVG